MYCFLQTMSDVDSCGLMTYCMPGMIQLGFSMDLMVFGYKLNGIGPPSYCLGEGFKCAKEPEDVLTWVSTTLY